MSQAPLPSTTDSVTSVMAEARRGWFPQVQFPNYYVWFVLFGSMDIMLTWVILHLGGSEVNPIARRIIDRWDLPGAIAFKFTLMIIVLLVCEFVGTRRRALGLLLAIVAIVVSAFPVLYSFVLLAIHTPRMAH